MALGSEERVCAFQTNSPNVEPQSATQTLYSAAMQTNIGSVPILFDGHLPSLGHLSATFDN